MTTIQTRLEGAKNPVDLVFLSGQPSDGLAERIAALIEAKLLKIVVFDGAAGVMLQSTNGPCLYVSRDGTSPGDDRRAGWQVRAFIDAIEAAAV